MPHGNNTAPQLSSLAEALHWELERLDSGKAIDADPATVFTNKGLGACELFAESRDDLRERRFFPRYALHCPAVAQMHGGKRSIRYASCVVSELAFNSVRVEFRPPLADAFLSEGLDGFELLFSLPEKKRSVCLRCRVARLQITADTIIVGATCDQSRLERQRKPRRTSAT
ncbi:MAG: hypothetical protein ACOCWR_11625 [Oceanidesulfovibrio sp.]